MLLRVNCILGTVLLLILKRDRDRRVKLGLRILEF
jgi:hypothetical protein